jgi:hypothetical protein
LTIHFHGETGAKRRDCDVRAHPPNAQLLGLVRAKAHHAGAMGSKIVRFRRESSIGSGEQQLVRNQCVERPDIGGQLRRAQLRFGVNDASISISRGDSIHRSGN